MFSFEQFSNLAQTTLAAPVSAGANLLVVNNASNFPASGQFRIVIDSEILLVTEVSGNNFIVTPGYENTTQANHSAGAIVAHVMTAGVATQLYNHTLGTIGFYEYYPAGIGSTADTTTPLQNFLLYCQLVALNLKSSALDDQAQRVFVTAYLPRGNYYISCPMVVPELVNLVCDGVIIRMGSGGTITANYTGDTTSQALANLYQPAVIIVPRAHCKTLNLYCNNDGVHLGAGLLAGKNWTVQSFAVGAGGAGYQVGDVLVCAQPSQGPYIAATASVTSVNNSGAVTAVSVIEPGAYGLPPLLQKQQWTPTNGFSVFDGSGHILTSGGHGSGVTLTPSWVPDWVSGNASYQQGRGGLVADTVLKHIRIMHVDVTTDSAYGPMVAFALTGLNFCVDDVEVQGGAIGISFNFAADVRADKLNCVGSGNGFICFGSTNIVATNVVIDTPHFWALSVDQGQGIRLQGRIFNRNLFNYTGSGNYTIAVGLNSNATSGQDVEGLTLDFQLTNAGSGGTPSGNPALYAAYLIGSRIDLAITNYTSASGVAPVTSFAAFGSGVDISNDLRGSIDQVTGALFSGTIPGCGIAVWDSAAGGYARVNGSYELFGSGAPTSGGSGTGASKAGPGSTYTDTTGGGRYINTGSASSPSWHSVATS